MAGLVSGFLKLFSVLVYNIIGTGSSSLVTFQLFPPAPSSSVFARNVVFPNTPSLAFFSLFIKVLGKFCSH